MEPTKRSLNLEKETKASDLKNEKEKAIAKNLESRTTDPATGMTQYPAKPGHHGSDDEKKLNPEE